MSAGRESVVVLGAGSWGTALAVLLIHNGQGTVLWGNEPDHIKDMRAERENRAFLPGISLPEDLYVTSELGIALEGARDVLLAVPSDAFREVLQAAEVYRPPGARVAWATKGFEVGTGRLLHEVVADIAGANVPAAVVSGPTFANEVAQGLPAAVTIASTVGSFAQDLARRLHGGHFRAYTSEDIIGVQVGGAVKNVLAIAAGVADGLGFGANTRAALVTRGLAEIMRLGVFLGGKPETFMGLAGLGDLVLTCTEDQSRNRRLGLALAKGESARGAAQAIGQVVEGIQTTFEVLALARKHKVEMPITEQVARVLREECSPRQAVDALLARDLKRESSNQF